MIHLYKMSCVFDLAGLHLPMEESKTFYMLFLLLFRVLLLGTLCTESQATETTGRATVEVCCSVFHVYSSCLGSRRYIQIISSSSGDCTDRRTIVNQ